MKAILLALQHYILPVCLILFILIAVFLFLFVLGSDMRRRNPEYRREMDEKQMRVISEMQERNQKDDEGQK